MAVVRTSDQSDCVADLVELDELQALHLAAAAPDRTDVQHPFAELDEITSANGNP